MGLATIPPRAANVPLARSSADIAIEAVDLIAADGAPSSGLLYLRRGQRPTIGVHLMHPRTDQTRNYNAAPLAERGFMVLARNGRSVNNDVDTLHEELLLDVAAGVSALRARGCSTVILLGNSGGGALAAMYQAQAEAPPERRLARHETVASTDLTVADLPPADGLMVIGGHLGQGVTLQQVIDASVVDEADPASVDPSLDIYDPRNGFRLPVAATRYDPEFVAEVRAAQRRRVERIDRLAKGALAEWSAARETAHALSTTEAPDSLARLTAERRANTRSYLCVYRTLADPAMIDTSIEPDDRVPGGFDGHPRPDLQNARQIGFAHLVSPRAWLSTWSSISSHASLERNLPGVSAPTLVVHYDGDIFTRRAAIERVTATSGSSDVQFDVVAKTDHYGRAINDDQTLGPRRADSVAIADRWMKERFT